MQVNTIRTPQPFEPITLNLTIETKEELEQLQQMFGLVSAPQIEKDIKHWGKGYFVKTSVIQNFISKMYQKLKEY